MSLDERNSAARKIEHLCSASLGMTLFPPCESDSETILPPCRPCHMPGQGRGAKQICLAKSISRGRRWADRQCPSARAAATS